MIPQRTQSLNALTRYSLGILAGGQGRRWGGRDKGLIIWRGRPLIDHICQARPAAAVHGGAAGLILRHGDALHDVRGTAACGALLSV